MGIIPITRRDITSMLPEDSIGAELGVFEGDFSQELVTSNKFKKLWLVDVFQGRASNFGKVYYDASVLENIVTNRFKEVEEVEVVKSFSTEFLKDMPENVFDFIYIDTTHEYHYTVLELSEGLRCMKHGGLLCGHDYDNYRFPGVVKAVNEFCDRYELSLQVTYESELPSFIIKIIKP